MALARATDVVFPRPPLPCQRDMWVHGLRVGSGLGEACRAQLCLCLEVEANDFSSRLN